MSLRPVPFLALVAVLAVVPAAAAPDDVAATYAERVRVTAAAGASLQKLDVPARVLAASRDAELGDLRIFDSRGRSLPIALSPLAAPRVLRIVRLEPLPILGSPDALTARGVSLRIDAGRINLVPVQRAPAEASAAKLLGVLLDTRGLADPVDRLRLVATVPRGRPIGFTVEASSDLRNWEALGETTLYAAVGGPVAGKVDLPSLPLAGRFLRVTWSPNDSVSVSSASVMTTRAADPAGWPRAIVRPSTADAKAIGLVLPFATSVTALEVAVGGGNAVVPVRILGRNHREQPWAVVASGSVFRIMANGVVRRNPPFDLSGTTYRALRIEADERSAGFAMPPTIAVRFAPVRLLFLASDAPPFTLVAGRPGAAPAFVPASSLVPGYSAAAEAALPLATALSGADPVIVAANEDSGRRLNLLLWGVLFAATALLGAMVWRLMRQRPPADRAGSLVDEKLARSEP